MPLKQFPNRLGTYISPMFNGWYHQTAQGSSTIDAAGESRAIIGKVFLEAGSGSKTISSAGGKIHWRTSSVTFVSGSTNLRMGIQDLASTGLEDGTYDVQADLVGGTDTITANSIMSTPMESGSKTISHGDQIAVVIEMTARGGADSVQVQGCSSNVFGMPYGSADTGVLAKTATVPYITIEFDDGTVGWFHPCHALPGNSIAGTSISPFGSASTPDERALIFKLPVTATLCGVSACLSPSASTSDFELILYSNPLKNPVAERTVSFDGDITSVTAQAMYNALFSEFVLQRNVEYAIAVRPTTANTLSTYEYAFGSTALMKPTVLGTNWYLGTRTDQTGAFSTTTTTIPHIGLWLSKLHDGQDSEYIPT